MIRSIVTFAAVFGLSGAVCAQRPDGTTEPFRQIFPQGAPMPATLTDYFIGQAYLAPLTSSEALHAPISNVTFSPGCRNNWHSHTGGQLLIVTAGRGYYQEEGRPARLLLPGDVVEIAPDVVHWHGAAPDSWFAHLAVETNSQSNRNTWLGPVDDGEYAAAVAGAERRPPQPELTAMARRNYGRLSPGGAPEWASANPELATVVGNFALDEVQGRGLLDERTRLLTLLASSVALQSEGFFRSMLERALNGGITPVEAREVLYQAVPYVGFAKVSDFITLADGVFEARGVRLPLEEQATTDAATRYERGLAVQKSIFGEQIDRMYASSPEEQLHIQRYLSANCFGDYYTRRGLDLRERELLTFAMLVSMGGCESQVKGHVRGNAAVGNDKAMMLETVTQLLPYIGYPRSLNAIACINEVLPE